VQGHVEAALVAPIAPPALADLEVELVGDALGRPGALDGALLRRRRGGHGHRLGELVLGGQGQHGAADQDPQGGQGACQQATVRIRGHGGTSYQALDAFQQRTVAGAQGKPRGGVTQLLEIDQRPGVGELVSGEFDGDVVAAVLALVADLPRDPPHGGVIEEQGLGDDLEQVDQVVASPDVGQLVGQDALALPDRQTRQRAHRYQHDRLEPADDHGDLHGGRA